MALLEKSRLHSQTQGLKQNLLPQACKNTQDKTNRE
jgi:hypothetical protein